MSCTGLDSATPAAVISAVKNRMMWRNMAVKAAFAYNDGLFAWPAADVTKLEGMGVKVASISAVPGGHAMIYDTEKGDWTPAQSSAAMGEDARAGKWPVAYVNRSNKATVIADMAGEGLKPGALAPKGFGLWVATLDGTFHDADGSDLRTQPGVVGVQYAQADSPVHTPNTQPDLDVSVVTAAGELWLGLATPLSNALHEVTQTIAYLQDVERILRSQGA